MMCFSRSFVVIGAPKANSTQSGVMGGGGVFLCPLSDGDQSCDIINFDLKGKFLTFNQAKVHSDTWTVLSSQACAPLFHWNVQRDGAESGATPVGNCFLLDHRTGNSSIFSPCRGTMVEDDYKQIKNSKIKSWSEGGFRFRTGLSLLVASYFGHSVAVTDINRDGLDDVVIGAPLFMDRVMEQLQERGQVVVYLQKKHTSFKSQPDQSLIGFSLYGRFGSALAVLGDLDMDGYHDVAVGAPWSGDTGQGQVFIYLGNSNGLSSTPSQVIDSPLSNGLTAFGFTLRGGSDVDDNGYPDLLVGAWAADRAFVYRSQAVIRCRVSLSLFPDFLNPDVKQCLKGETSVSCFNIKICVYVSGHRIPQETALWVDLQLDKMKQTMARRTSLLSTNQPQKIMMLVVHREVGVACMNLTAYLRSEDEFRDKLSPIFTTLNISLNTIQNALLYGQTHAAAQSRIILDCGDDNICVPDLKLRGVNKLVCVQRKKNESVIVTCDLGNPMTHRQTVTQQQRNSDNCLSLPVYSIKSIGFIGRNAYNMMLSLSRSVSVAADRSSVQCWSSRGGRKSHHLQPQNQKVQNVPPPVCSSPSLSIDLSDSCLSLSKNPVNSSSALVRVEVQVRADATLELRG
uniref:Integrin, alpha 2b n=1 Tax=Echeneis naucrates TaxID=173247 RepID=A0A665WJQ6_ECHNA